MLLEQIQIDAIVRRVEAKHKEAALNAATEAKKIKPDELEKVKELKKLIRSLPKEFWLISPQRLPFRSVYGFGFGDDREFDPASWDYDDEKLITEIFYEKRTKAYASATFDTQKLKDDIIIAMIEAKDLEELKKKLSLDF